MPLSRSEIMARIKGQNTSPELALKAALEAAGIQLATGIKVPVGRPDLIIQTPPIAIFIDGCFWHGCPTHYVRPGTREEFWAEKLKGNVERDCRQTLALEQAGWLVLRVWEHEVFTEPDRVVQEILELMAGVVREPQLAWRVAQVDVLDPLQRLERRHLVELRNPEHQRTEDGRRNTKKWKVPSEQLRNPTKP